MALPLAISREDAIKLVHKSNPVAEQGRIPAIPLRAWRLAFGICVLAVLVLALMPSDVPIPSTGWDKTNHLLAFSVMALMGRRAYPGRTMAVLAGLLAYGALIEVLQSLTPNRSAQWQDLVADAIGLAFGWWVDQLARHMRRSRTDPQA